MKTSMNKLAVFVMMAAIVMLTVAATASADAQQSQMRIQGEYAVTGTNNCVVAPLGFDTTLAPVNGVYLLFQGYIEGIYTFYSNGKGSFKSIMHGTLQAGPAISASLPISASESSFDYNFTYTVTDDGVITFTVVPCAQTIQISPTAGAPSYNNDGPHNGVISLDGENLIVNCGPPVLLTACTGCTGVGSNNCTVAPGATQFACGISLAGFRIPKPFALPE